MRIRTFSCSILCFRLTWAIELRSSEKCEWYMTCAVCKQNANIYVRYANTLLVSLNNRIYFRERRPVTANSTFFAIPDRVHGTVLTSPSFAAPGVQLRELKGSIYCGRSTTS